MAEVGLVGFARVALDVARSVLPDYRSKFSKHIFTQPQLLAIVCLMRYEGWRLCVRPKSVWRSIGNCERLCSYTKPPITLRSIDSLIGSMSGC
jgi:hypothetical protein